MKILIATGLYAPEIGGPATHTEILEHALPLCDIDVAVVPFSVVRKYPKVIRHIAYMAALFMQMRGASLVYALDPVSVGLPALIVAQFLRKKFVLRVAGDYAWEQAVGRFGCTEFLDDFVHNTKVQPLMVRLLARIERYVARHADVVVVPSQYLERIVLAWGVPKEKIKVIYNAFEPLHVLKTKEVIRNERGYAGTVIVSAGRLVSWKGFRTLIALVAELQKEQPVSCVIVGDGPDRAMLGAHAQERGVAQSVRFVGRQSKEDLAEILVGADMFVLNTAYEGFSHQILEVMALGIPVITTEVGGNGELVANDETGLLVPYDDKDALKVAFVRLMEDLALRYWWVAGDKARATSFTTTRMVDGVQAVFAEISKK